MLEQETLIILEVSITDILGIEIKRMKAIEEVEMFKVKATLTEFLGDLDNYPCHFCHNVGDEVIFDGEKYIGRLCPDVWPILTPKVAALHCAGPRYVDPEYYYPFWYCCVSKSDPSKKKYDGLGFRNVLKTREVPPYHMATLIDPNAFKWPPHPERSVAKDPMVKCPDLRTAAVFRLEAFDLSDKGFDVPYFRRQMSILDKVLNNQGIEPEKIIDTFSQELKDEVYPPLSPEMMTPLIEELELMEYLEIKDRTATVTEKGKVKLEDYKASLTDEEREALEI